MAGEEADLDLGTEIDAEDQDLRVIPEIVADQTETPEEGLDPMRAEEDVEVKVERETEEMVLAEMKEMTDRKEEDLRVAPPREM